MRTTTDQPQLNHDLAQTALLRTMIHGDGGFSFQSTSFPWGSQWCWGFEWVTVDDAPAFRIHNPSVMIGPKYTKAIMRDSGFGPGSRYKTITEIPEAGEWGVAVDVDWAGGAPVVGTPVIVTSEAEISIHPDEPTTTTVPGRIPVAWFDGRTLIRYYIHGMFMPQVWADI